jgi:hypothetical protein
MQLEDETMQYDLLLSGDMMLPDPDGMANLLTEKLGIYQHKNWRQAFDNHPYIAHFLRVHRSLAMSPTRIEPQWHLDKPNPGDPLFHDFLESLKDFQGRHRPMVTHAVVLTCLNAQLGALIDRLHSRKLRFRLAQRTKEMPFDRLWFGATPEDPVYKPDVDGGLCIEIIPTEAPMFPPETFADPCPEPEGLSPGDMVRVTRRGFLVRNLDWTLARCAENIDLEPTEPVKHLTSEGYKLARFGFRSKQSATLDVIEPTQWDSTAGLYLHNWGPGLYYIRIAVLDLKARAEQLKEKGVAFDWIEESDAVDGRPLIRVAPSELRGQMFEFEEYVSPNR